MQPLVGLITGSVMDWETLRHAAEILGRRSDGVLAGIDSHGLKPASERFVPIRLDGSLIFANVA